MTTEAVEWIPACSTCARLLQLASRHVEAGMTVADLIRELQAMPNQQAQVRVVPGSIIEGNEDDAGERQILLGDEDATEACEVRHMGPLVLAKGL